MKSNVFFLLFYVLCIGSLLCSLGCLDGSNDSEVSNPDDNINTPSGNELIDFEYISSDGDRNATVDFIAPLSNGAAYFFGIDNGDVQLGKLDNSGSITWRHKTDFFIRDLLAVDINGPKLIAVGGNDSDDDSRSDEGVLMILDDNGALLSETKYSIQDTGLFFNGIAAYPEIGDDVQLLISGAARITDELHPVIFRLQIPSVNIGDDIPTSAFNNRRIFTDMSRHLFVDIAVQPSIGPAPEMIFVTLNQLDGSAVTERFSLARIEPDLTALMWQTDVLVAADRRSEAHFGQTIHIGSDRVWVIGNTDDDEVDTGSFWSAGLLAAFDKNTGAEAWKQKIDLSERSDRAIALLVDGDELYVSGYYSAYASGLQSLGFGFLGRFAQADGEQLGLQSFGATDVFSGLNGVNIDGNEVLGYGFTNLITGSTFDRWVIRLPKGAL